MATVMKSGYGPRLMGETIMCLIAEILFHINLFVKQITPSDWLFPCLYWLSFSHQGMGSILNDSEIQ